MTEIATPSPSPSPAPTPSRRAVVGGIGAAGLVGVTAGRAGAATGRATRRTARVVVGGKVFTGLPGAAGATAQAVAIGTDGLIQAVGSDREIRRMADSRTEVVDARGATVMAGIHDGHMHPLGAAAAALNPSLANAVLTVGQLQAELQGFLDASATEEPDRWLVVNDWNPVGLLPAGTVADRSMLDALRTKRPVYLQGSDFHNSLVNTRALALAGVTRSTANPPGGEIVRGADGEATGLLKDAGQGVVRQAVPGPTEKELRGAYATMSEFLLSVGIVAFQDSAASEDSVATYRDLLESGGIRQRVTPALTIPTELFERPGAAVSYLRSVRRRHRGVDGLSLTTAKVFVDGVMEFPAQTAALLTPYLDEDGRPTDHRGDLYISSKDYRALAVAVDGAGWQLHSHAIGDRAVRTALDAYEAAVAAHGRRARAHRHTITHLQLVHPRDLARFARTGTLASMQLQWAQRNAFTLDALRPYIGEERFARLYPARSLQRAGAMLVGGSDWPVDPLSPYLQIATAVDRTAEGPKPLGRSEALSRAASLRMHTAGGAHQLHHDDAGVLAPGKRADLVVMDRDLFAGSTTRLRKAKVEHTLIGGKVVYDASSSDARTLARRAGGLAVARGHDHGACCG